MQQKAIIIYTPGDTSHLVYATAPVPEITAATILVKNTVIAVNFHDIYVRNGLYRTLSLPGIPGLEAVGEVIAVGDKVTEFKIGDRVHYINPALYGAYAAITLIPAARAHKIPPAIADLTAANLLRMLTVEMLVNEITLLKPGQTALVHAGAGNIGQILCRRLCDLGIKVIAGVGSDAKIKIAEACGYSLVLNYTNPDFSQAVQEYTRNQGVNVVYDSVGKNTFTASLAALGYLGHFIAFGQASGAPPPLPILALAEKSLSLTRPLLFHYLAVPSLKEKMYSAVFTALEKQQIQPVTATALPLAQAAAAHALLESRQALAPIVLIP